MQKSKSSGLLARKHVLDAEEATRRLKLMRVIEQETQRLERFQQDTTNTATQAIEELAMKVKQQGADAICTFKYECESKLSQLHSLLSNLGKSKRPSDPLHLLPLLAYGHPLLSLTLTESLSLFQLTRYVDFHADWSHPARSEAATSPSSDIGELNIDIQTASRVGTLDLSNKAIGLSELQELYKLAHIYTSVRDLDLSYSKLSEEAVAVVGKCLNRLKTLERLMLKGNTLTGGLVRVLALNAGVCKELQTLDVEENLLGSTCGEIGNSLSTCFPGLKTLIFRGNSLKNEDLVALCRVLPLLVELERVDLSGNQIGGVGVRAFTHALPLMGALTHIDLSENEIKDDAGVGLAAVLPVATRLISLSLAYNHLGERAVASFVDAAEELLWLEDINLEGNRISRSSLRPVSSKRVRV